jgi:hypothetical protein
MEEIKELTSFYEAIWNDPRIGPTHISLYMALFQLYNLNGFRNPVHICRKRVMEIAKISGFATFHKCIKDLCTFGYVQYSPSYDPTLHSQVNLLKL